VDAQIWGGSGDDQIKAGSGNDVVFGGAGDDKLYGGDGRDILVGGTGLDRIYGDKHDDILIAGYTAFDEDFNQLAPISLFPPSARLNLNVQRLAIEAIMAEWTSNRNYNQRRANISGTGSGPRNNGTRYLKFDVPVVTNNTVFDDGVEDKIWGDSGLDWFLANTDGPSNTRDDVKDRSGSEVVSDTDRWW
jgi:Ca2+-binding RTX toxin-like protein